MKPSVLILLAYYLPSRKSGGPIRSISNLVETLGDEIQFRIFTADRDDGDAAPYPGIESNTWIRVGKCAVMYLSPDRLRVRSILNILAAEPADFLYVNSFFARRFSIIPIIGRAAGFSAQRSAILAPRGEFSAGALNLKPWRKRLYIAIARRLPVYRRIVWQASSQYEQRDIASVFGPAADIRCAMPLSPPDTELSRRTSPVKRSGALHVVFLSRIVPMKNLLTAVRLLKSASGIVKFDIYGPAEDRDYWAQCLSEMKSLPANISVEYKSLVEHAAVASVFAAHHLFLFPTLGENYGHVIFEALNAGCPVLISDRTPWRGLESAGAGWDLPLERPDLFHPALERCIAMTEEEFQAASACARAFAVKFKGDNPRQANRALFA